MFNKVCIRWRKYFNIIKMHDRTTKIIDLYLFVLQVYLKYNGDALPKISACIWIWFDPEFICSTVSRQTR
jgi:hypothetical protein